MLSIPEIRDQLLIDAAVQAEESIDESTVDRYIEESISEHNSAYDVDGSNLPSREIPLVKLLAWIKLTTLRASKWATKNSLTNHQGYGSDRDTPFAKLSKQAADLRKEYDRRCVAMGIANDAGGDSSMIVQGQLSVVDLDGDYRTPYTNDRTPLVAPTLLQLGTSLQTELTIQWTKSLDPTFSAAYVFYKTGASQTLYDETNVDSTTGVPRIVDTAIKLWSVVDADFNSLKVSGLTANSSYTFIVAVQNRQSRWVYSAALSLTTAV